MAINVLMLGWELPPYNSGGLGTACLGLTQGLATQNVGIDFVVPKLFGTLPYDHMRVLSAADYGSETELAALMSQAGSPKDFFAYQLAYGAHLSVDDQKRLHIDYSSQHTPSPQQQAEWYAEQSETIAEENPTFDVVHAHDWMTYYGGIAARDAAQAQGREVPFIAHVHATEIDRAGVNGDRRIMQIERKGLTAADHVIAVSEFTKEQIHRHYKVPYKKISVVHNGIPKPMQPVRSNLSALKKHHKIVLFMGRITMQKGPDYYVKLAKAVTDIDPSVRFVMAGSGDMEKRCIEEAARLGLTGKMLFSSFLRGQDVDTAYQMADLFVMPSVSEPFGIVALEAMRNGTPVLVSKQSGVAEVSEHVAKVDFWDTTAMRDQVLQILSEPRLAQQLRTGAYQDLQSLTWNEAAKTMQGVYTRLLKTIAPTPVALRLA